MNSIKIKVYGKINLSLDVIGLYGGGFHELDMSLCSVDCYDTLEFLPSESTAVYMDGRLADGNNTVNKVMAIAAEEISGVKGGIVRIGKGIPMCAGMGGSSADASGTLYCLNKLYGVCGEKLYDIARRVGSDVTYMLEGGFKRAKGKGEELTDLPFFPLWLVVIQPSAGSSTKEVFNRFDEIGGELRSSTQKVADAMKERRDFLPLMYNALQEPAITLNPSIGGALEDIRRYTPAAMMSGSGSAVFGIFQKRAQAVKAAEELMGKYSFCRVCTTVMKGIEELS